MTERKITSAAPADEKQRRLLRLAVAKEWLSPNPFSEQYEKWEKLTEKEATQLLAAIPRERLGLLEQELRREDSKHGHRTADVVGRKIESMVHEIGRTIDGGF